MPSGRLLIVAPDVDLRRSLEFLLEAEGHVVVSCAGIAGVDTSNFDCTILDHRAILAPHGEMMAFCRKARPVILLAGSPLTWLTEEIFRVVQKPLLGQPLIAAVDEALRSRRPLSSSPRMRT